MLLAWLPAALPPSRTKVKCCADRIAAPRADARANEALVVEAWLSIPFWEHDDLSMTASLIAASVRDRETR